MKKNHPFEPVFDSASKILILGTMPSIASVQQGFYYMHPQNRFWKILSKIYETDVYNASLEEKKHFLIMHHLAVYDVVSSCDIDQSKDDSIKDVEYADIRSILNQSCIEKILLNGKKAYQLFLKKYPEYNNIAYCLPSTSPANAQIHLDELVRIWQDALRV